MRKEWFWCVYCERAFESDVPDNWERGWFLDGIGKEVVTTAGVVKCTCPYDGCDGSPIDFFPWDDIREDDPSLPAVPEEGVIYSPGYDGFPDPAVEKAPRSRPAGGECRPW